ncbi:MAG: diguanylate cyclase [Desulfobacterales bacterium]|nr:diguanylate cyclase [Desulfobacterales bacterium]
MIWSVGVLSSSVWNIFELKQSILKVARTSAEVSYEKDVVYRKWAAMHGGVYVPVSKTTPPNPYLNIPYRDVITSEGRSLTLVNPAYMIRQVNELNKEIPGGHIASLNPIRPENGPDPWERASLKAFERGIQEASAIERMAGKETFRLMRPFVAEKPCLKCHESQGCKEGDILGGMSVSILMEGLRAIERSRMAALSLAHGFLWIMGLIGIWIGTRHLSGQIHQREKAEEELRALSITDQLTGLHNRRGFLSLAEQQLKLTKRSKKRLILFFADMDGLKQINDVLGHEEGDQAISEAAAILKETFRSSDIVARMGGDEFVALAIDSEEINPQTMIDRFQSRIETHNHTANRRYKLSVSVGFASLNFENPSSLDELLAEADQRMYEQKKGRLKDVLRKP